jgi:FkbM family methyltransferase
MAIQKKTPDGFPDTIGYNRMKATRHGRMLFNPRDRYVGRSLDVYGEFSEGEAALFRQLLRPGAVVLDAGAHIGTHTLVFARAVGPEGGVLAFEPQRLLFQALCTNMAINAVTHVHAYHAAAGRSMGHVIVPVLDYRKEDNFAGLSLEGHTSGEKVARVPIDALELARCHLMKIDVEGMEEAVIEGAAGTIERCRPVIYVENDRKEKSPDLIRRLLALNYDLYWHLPPLFNPDNHFGYGENIFGDVVSVNMLCFHKQMGAQVDGLQRVEGPGHWVLG